MNLLKDTIGALRGAHCIGSVFLSEEQGCYPLGPFSSVYMVILFSNNDHLKHIKSSLNIQAVLSVLVEQKQVLKNSVIVKFIMDINSMEYHTAIKNGSFGENVKVRKLSPA